MDMKPSTETATEPVFTLGDLLSETETARRGEREKIIIETEDLKRPSFSLDAERGLISAALYDGEAVLDKAEDAGLKAEDFYLVECATIWSAMLSLSRKKRAIDSVTVVEELNRKAKLRSVGGAVAVSKLSGSVVSSAMAKAYSEIIIEQSRIRSLQRTIATAKFEIENGTATSTEIINQTRMEMSNLEVRGGSIEFNISDVTKSVLDSMPAFGGTRDVVKTGFLDLDNLIGGFGGGDLIVVAGRPSMGKTCWGLDVARHVALGEKKPVLIFSLEMTDNQLVERLIGAQANVETKKKTFNAVENRDVVEAAGTISEAPIIIDDTAGLSVGNIRARARKAHAKHGLGLVVIDYMQLLTSERNLDSRTGEMSETSNSLKRLARELRCPVVAMSQLTRGPESRLNKRPLMSDLRESGAIEQDADMVALLYREEYYGGEKTPDESKGIAELIISKNRNGPTGVVKLHFASSIPKFSNHTQRAM